MYRVGGFPKLKNSARQQVLIKDPFPFNVQFKALPIISRVHKVENFSIGSTTSCLRIIFNPSLAYKVKLDSKREIKFSDGVGKLNTFVDTRRQVMNKILY